MHAEIEQYLEGNLDERWHLRTACCRILRSGRPPTATRVVSPYR
jgi:hypothetical protein